MLRVTASVGLSIALSSLPLAAGDLWQGGEDGVIFSEIHYHPAGDVEGEEFVEVHNWGSAWIDLEGWTLAGGVEFEFPPGAAIGPGEYLAVARSRATLEARLPAGGAERRITGDFKGKLSNSGEILVLKNRIGRIVAWVHYKDGGGRGCLWPDRPDGDGPSLELLRPGVDYDHPWHWMPSRLLGGTPGAPNSVSVPESSAAIAEGGAEEEKPRDRPRVRINELGMDGGEPFVELHNPGGAAERLDGLRLVVLAKDAPAAVVSELSGSLRPGRFTVVRGGKLQALGGPGALAVALLQGERGLVDLLDLARPWDGRTAARVPDGKGRRFVQAAATPGAPNQAPHPPAVVINEIFYHGREDRRDEEFVEIHNPSRSEVPLAGWRLEGAVEFAFPSQARLAGEGYLVVAADPEKVARLAGTAGAGRILGPFQGGLSNQGETIELVDADGNRVDRVSYGDRRPWPREADGGGFSLELIDPGFDNRWPEAWAAGLSPGGENRARGRGEVLHVTGVRHQPAVPEPGESVTVHAHVLSTVRLREVAVFYSEFAGENQRAKPRKVRLQAVGSGEDAAAGDGHYTGVIKPRGGEGTLVGYRVGVRTSSRWVEFPAGGREFYLVLEKPDPIYPDVPVYRVLMPPEEWALLERARSRSQYAPCTFIASVHGPGVNDDPGEVYHEAGIRYRGSNSFGRPEEGRMSYRVRLKRGDFFDGRDRLILNGDKAYRQKEGCDTMKLMGLRAPRVVNVRLRTPRADDPQYVDVEPVNSNFLRDKFGSSAGELFRGFRGRPGADLAYHGDDPDPLLAAYRRVNKEESRDVTRLVELLQALSARDEDGYAERVEKLVDVPAWMAYFAVNNVLANDENAIHKDDADDYYLYFDPDGGRWVIVPWDHDSVYWEPNLHWPLFRPSVPSVRRFLRHPAFAPYFHRVVRRLLDGPFSPASLRRRTAPLVATFGRAKVEALERFLLRRRLFLAEGFYPSGPFAGARAGGPTAAPAGGGFSSRVFVPRGTRSVTLWGQADPALAFTVRLGTRAARYNPQDGSWSLSADLPRSPASFWIDLVDRSQAVAASYPLQVEETGAIRRVPASLAGSPEWGPGASLYLVEGTVTVPSGSTLKVAAGTQILCGPGALIVVRGRILAEGEPLAPVCFRLAEGRNPWQGCVFLRAGAGSVFRHVRFEGGVGQALPVGRAEGTGPAPRGGGPGEGGTDPSWAPFLHVLASPLELDQCVLRGVQGVAVGAWNSSLKLRRTTVAGGRHGITVRGGELEMEGCRLARLWGRGLTVAGLSRTGRVADCSFRRLGTEAIRVDGAEVVLEGCTVSLSAAGLAAGGGARLRASRLTLVENGVGLQVDVGIPQEPGRPGGAASGVHLSESVIFHNAVGLEKAPASRVELEKCRLRRPVAAGATAARDAVFDPPRFSDPVHGDFRLRGGERPETAGPRQGEATPGGGVAAR